MVLLLKSQSRYSTNTTNTARYWYSKSARYLYGSVLEAKAAKTPHYDCLVPRRNNPKTWTLWSGWTSGRCSHAFFVFLSHIRVDPTSAQSSQSRVDDVQITMKTKFSSTVQFRYICFWPKSAPTIRPACTY